MPPALLSLLDRVGGPRRALILVVGLAVAAGLFGLARWAGAPAWVPAFTGLPLSEVGSISDRLTQAGIAYRLDRSGNAILVQETDVAKARVALAQAGILTDSRRKGYDEIFGGSETMMGRTDRQQRLDEQRALEGELERTLGAMRGIRSARVLLTIPEPESYGAVAPPSEASVMLESRGPEGIHDEVVRGIARHVAAAVPGLTSDHVTIIDESGRPLSIGDEPESATALTNRQLEHQGEVERSLRQKVERLLLPVVGSRNATVQVTAALSFDRVARSSVTVDPERQALVTESKSELIPGADGGAGKTEIANSYQNTSASEEVTSAVGTVKRLTVAVLLAAPPAPVPSAADAGAAAAAAPGAAPSVAATDTAALRAQVETLVKSAVGFDEARGDLVTVAMLPFVAARPLPPAAAPSTLETLQQVQRPALGALGILLAFVVGLLALRAAGKTTESVTPLGAPMLGADQLAPGLAGAYAGAAGLPAGAHRDAHALAGASGAAPGASGGAAPRPIPMIHIPNNPIREQVVAAVDQQPEVAAKLMRAWLRDG